MATSARSSSSVSPELQRRVLANPAGDDRIRARFARRAALGVLLLAATLATEARSDPLPRPAEDARLLAYAVPGQRVDVGGRRINLHCLGSRGPSVVLLSGLFSWSVVWYKVQPAIARQARVCAFDRAAYGFSDPPLQPQILSDVVDDLHAALQAASIPQPYVLVGHSLGGLEARLYAERWPRELAGLVLVDPSPAGEMLREVGLPDYDEAEGRETYAASMLKCALLAARGAFNPASEAFRDCSARLPLDTPDAFRQAWPRFFTADYFAAKVSLMSSLYTHRYDSVDRRALGDLPLVVLTAKNTWGNTSAGIRFTQTFLEYWMAQHEALSQLSTRGQHRFIDGSGHEIPLDKPEAIIDAVETVLGRPGGP